jgi:hypothetical protein
MKRRVVLLMFWLAGSCGDNASLRKQARASIDECGDDSECAAGYVCRQAVCQLPDSADMAIRPLAERTTEAFYRRLGAVDFGAGRGEEGHFELLMGVGQARQMQLQDDITGAGFRARFSPGLKAKVWGVSITASGGEIRLAATSTDPERVFVLENIVVESQNESAFQLEDAGFPKARGLAVMDLKVSADLGANVGETVRMTAMLHAVECKVEFDVRNGHLAAKVESSEQRTLFGVPDGVSVEAIALTSDVTGAEIPADWL